MITFINHFNKVVKIYYKPIINLLITFFKLLLPLMVIITIINKTVNRVKEVISNSIIKKNKK